MATRHSPITPLAGQDKPAQSWVRLNSENALRGAPDWVEISAADSPFTPLPTDGLILANAAGGPITIALPALSTTLGIPLTVKKIDSSGNAVTLDGSGSEPIDTPTTLALSAQWKSATIWPYPGARWLLIAQI